MTLAGSNRSVRPEKPPAELTDAPVQPRATKVAPTPETRILGDLAGLVTG